MMRTHPEQIWSQIVEVLHAVQFRVQQKQGSKLGSYGGGRGKGGGGDPPNVGAKKPRSEAAGIEQGPGMRRLTTTTQPRIRP